MSAVMVAMALLSPPSPEEAAIKEAPVELGEEQVIDTASIQPTTPLKDATIQRPKDFTHLPEKLHAFRMEFLSLKPQILEKEEGYIFIGETPEEAKKDLAKSKKLLRDTKKWVDQKKHKMDRKLAALDEQAAQADQYCESASANQTQCERLADPVHYYEASVSTYIAMMEVMQRRYDEAVEALK